MCSFFDTNEKKDCNGCGVCKLKCPKKAIKMVLDDEGFLYPEINKDLCINCGLCKKICPNKNYPNNDKVKTYIAINNSKKDLENSSSGGCFLPIAQYIIKNGGVVFGVTYDECLNAIHDYVETEEELIKFQGSKYVKSDLNDSYQKVKEFLLKDKLVLFSGTPCQCQGLRTYIGKSDKLYTCEIICHANPSPKVFQYYKQNLENKKGKKVADIKFRSKKNGWHNQKPIIIYENGEEEEEEIYFYYGFVKELLNRPSCHNCYFCSTNRLSDFTIGDAWRIKYFDPEIKDDDTGISLLCINTDKGNKMKKYLEEKMMLKNVDTKVAFNYNHHRNVPMHKNRDKFYKGISSGKINEKNILKYIKKYGNDTLINNLKKIIKKIIKYK